MAKVVEFQMSIQKELLKSKKIISGYEDKISCERSRISRLEKVSAKYKNVNYSRNKDIFYKSNINPTGFDIYNEYGGLYNVFLDDKELGERIYRSVGSDNFYILNASYTGTWNNRITNYTIKICDYSKIKYNIKEQLFEAFEQAIVAGMTRFNAKIEKGSYNYSKWKKLENFK